MTDANKAAAIAKVVQGFQERNINFEALCSALFDAGYDHAAAEHASAIREAVQNVIRATEEAACSCSVCGVIKGENRGCYAYRASKGHIWKYIAYLDESDVQALTALKAELEKYG